MSFIQEPDAPHTDVMGTGPLLDNTRVTTAQQDAAWSTIQRHCPEDADTIGRMLGVVAS